MPTTQLDTTESLPPPSQPPSDVQSIMWLKTPQDSTKSVNKQDDLPLLTAYVHSGSNNCEVNDYHLTFHSLTNVSNHKAKLTHKSEKANHILEKVI